MLQYREIRGKTAVAVGNVNDVSKFSFLKSILTIKLCGSRVIFLQAVSIATAL